MPNIIFLPPEHLLGVRTCKQTILVLSLRHALGWFLTITLPSLSHFTFGQLSHNRTTAAKRQQRMQHRNNSAKFSNSIPEKTKEANFRNRKILNQPITNYYFSFSLAFLSHMAEPLCDSFISIIQAMRSEKIFLLYIFALLFTLQITDSKSQSFSQVNG